MLQRTIMVEKRLFILNFFQLHQICRNLSKQVHFCTSVSLILGLFISSLKIKMIHQYLLLVILLREFDSRRFCCFFYFLDAWPHSVSVWAHQTTLTKKRSFRFFPFLVFYQHAKSQNTLLIQNMLLIKESQSFVGWNHFAASTNHDDNNNKNDCNNIYNNNDNDIKGFFQPSQSVNATERKLNGLVWSVI